METQLKGVKSVKSQQWRHQIDVTDLDLVSLLLQCELAHIILVFPLLIFAEYVAQQKSKRHLHRKSNRLQSRKSSFLPYIEING